MNRDLAKSRAFYEKKKAEVEDGTADRDRHQRAKDQGLALNKLLDIKPIDLSGLDTMEKQLETISRIRGFVPLPPSFFARLDQDTRDWLFRFTLDPYTTSPVHPALEPCTVESERAFRVYIRTYETTVKEERERLLSFMDFYPQFTAAVTAKLQSLDPSRDAEDNDNTKIWGHYIGQTMSEAGPIARLESDLDQALTGPQDSTLLRWIRFTFAATTSTDILSSAASTSAASSSTPSSSSLVWKVYQFRSLYTPLATDSPASGDIWRSRPDLQELEAGLVLAADRRGWNSAPGGVPQTRYAVPSEVTQILSPLSDLLSTELLHTSFIPPSQGVRKHFQDNYAMAPAVLNRTVNQTASFGYQDGTTAMLLVGSRITRRDNQGDSDWWNNAGPACILWRLTFDAVRDVPMSQWTYDQVSLAKYGGFVDLYAVPPPPNPGTELYGQACALLSRLIGELIRPRVICLMSNEVRRALEEGRLRGTYIEEVEEARGPAGGWNIDDEVGAVKEAGSIRVEKVGDHYCVAVMQPHPGCFAYNPSIQPLLFSLFICSSAVARLAKAAASRTSMTWGERAAQSVVAEVLDQHILTDYLDGLKRQILSITSIQTSIRSLRRPMTVDSFNRQSAISQVIRKDFVDSDTVAIGAPHSADRMTQVDALREAGYQPGTVGQMSDVPKGKHFRISIYSRESKTELTTAAINKARESIDMVARDRKRRLAAATGGPWPGYSGNNPSVKEALDWVSSVPTRDDIKRTSGKDPVHCLFHCSCSTCGAVGLVRLNTRLHFCTVDGELIGGLSISAAASPVQFFKIVVPFALFFSHVRGEIEHILEGTPEAYRLRRIDGKIVSIIKSQDVGPAADAWEDFQVSLWEQLQAFKESGQPKEKVVNKLDMLFQSYIKGL